MLLKSSFSKRGKCSGQGGEASRRWCWFCRIIFPRASCRDCEEKFSINLWPLPLPRGALRLSLPTGVRGVNAERKEAGDRLRHPRPLQPAPGPQPLPPRAAAVAASRPASLGGARGPRRRAGGRGALRRRGPGKPPAALAGPGAGPGRGGGAAAGGAERSGGCHELSRGPAARCRGGDAADGGAAGAPGGGGGCG